MTNRQFVCEEYVLPLGRTVTEERGLRLEWTCSGFRFRFIGSRAAIQIYQETVPGKYRPYLRVAIDGRAEVIPVSESGQIVLAEALPYGAHTVEVLKITEPLEGTFLHVSHIEIGADGALPVSFGIPPRPSARRIEVVGDSITCGYGNCGAPDADEFHTGMEDGFSSYAARIARAFDADVHFVSKSGEGIVQNGSGETGYPIPDFYLSSSPSLRSRWDFSLWQPAAVIINAGTNDVTSGVDPARLEQRAAEFLKTVRRHNPQACLLWVYGAMNTEAAEALERAVGRVAAQDHRVFFHRLESVYGKPEEMGYTGHPNRLGHRRLAEALIPVVARITGWEPSVR